MKNSVARQMLREYYEISNPTEDDEFRFVEALEYLIGSTKDPKYMCELGWFYCSKKRFDLEVKYLEMAAEASEKSALRISTAVAGEYGFIPPDGRREAPDSKNRPAFT